MTWGRGSTRQSRRQRELVLAMHPFCYLRFTGCTVISTEDDHVIPVSQGGTDDLSNRRGACRNCHRKKSQRESGLGRRSRRNRPELPHPGLIEGRAPTPHPGQAGHRHV